MTVKANQQMMLYTKNIPLIQKRCNQTKPRDQQVVRFKFRFDSNKKHCSFHLNDNTFVSGNLWNVEDACCRREKQQMQYKQLG